MSGKKTYRRLPKYLFWASQAIRAPPHTSVGRYLRYIYALYSTDIRLQHVSAARHVTAPRPHSLFEAPPEPRRRLELKKNRRLCTDDDIQDCQEKRPDTKPCPPPPARHARVTQPCMTKTSQKKKRRRAIHEPTRCPPGECTMKGGGKTTMSCHENPILLLHSVPASGLDSGSGC